MQQSSLEKAIELINKTGDRLVVADKNSSSIFVVMSLRDYERLVLNHDKISDLTEDELLNKINRDIAIWKTYQEEKENEEKMALLEETNNLAEEDRYYFEPLDD